MRVVAGIGAVPGATGPLKRVNEELGPHLSNLSGRCLSLTYTTVLHQDVVTEIFYIRVVTFTNLYNGVGWLDLSVAATVQFATIRCSR